MQSTAVVTGGAGSIGSRIAARLAALGHRVVVADLDAAAVAATVKTIPAGAVGSAGDLTDPAAVRTLFGTAAELGPVQVLINSAGISPKQDGRKKGFAQIDAGEWRRVFDVNVLAPFLAIQAAVGLMPRDGSASIVNIGSITARMGTGGPLDAEFPPVIPSAAHYAASKGAVHTMGMSLARELAPLGIRLNTVAPGFVTTAMTAGVPGGENARILSQVPLGRAGVPDDVVGAVEYLVSDRAAYITGAVLDVNGGWLPAF